MTTYPVFHWSFIRRWPVPGFAPTGLYVNPASKQKVVSQRWLELCDKANELGLVAIQFEERITLASNGLYPLLLPLVGSMTIKNGTLRFEFGVPVLALGECERRNHGSWYVTTRP